ncbi:MAG: hypothetical protein NUV91_07700, partial [Candidatus Omnitrophica bacterium]|nr:hypothetical protein [Candidatus Omnitrophota bacterium]
KGHHMPGRMGAVRVTVQGLRVVDVDTENNRILIKGAVPGHKNAVLEINRSKKRAFRALDDKRVTEAKSRNPMKQSKAKTGGGAAAKGGKK